VREEEKKEQEMNKEEVKERYLEGADVRRFCN
jgi:hypothetical protein